MRERESEESALAEISVVIPCYNYGRFLRSAIDSVLAQGYPEMELIVVDDGSTDETPTVAASYGTVRYVRQENQGMGAARNRGSAEATGEFILFLDADDQLAPGALRSSVECLRDQPACAFAYGHQQFVDAGGSIHPADSERARMFRTCLSGVDPYAHMLRVNHPLRTPGAVLYRTEIFRRVGGFALEAQAAADLDLNLRIAREHPICCNDRVVLLSRLHGANTTTNAHEMLRGSVMVQRRQRPYVDEHPEYEEDYEAGLRLARSYWSAHLARQIATDILGGNVRSAADGLLAMARYAPAEGIVAAARLVRAKAKQNA